jgi:hypothetical protein
MQAALPLRGHGAFDLLARVGKKTRTGLEKD